MFTSATRSTRRLLTSRREVSSPFALGARQFGSELNDPLPGASEATISVMEKEKTYGAANYAPMPVVLKKGRGPFVWDVDNKRYFDFLSAYSAVNQGHCHPRIVNALTSQAWNLTLVSRAFYSDALADYSEFVCKYFDMDRVLPMNSGVEACETAIKLARRWAYVVKGVPENQAQIIFAENNFWGRSIAAVSSSTDPSSYTHYGPLVPNFVIAKYNDVDAIKQKMGPNVAAVMLEPIQGEAGVVVPDDGYLREVKKLCEANNVLLIADEIQTGLGRTGKRLCVDWDSVKPDILTLGKALSGGLMPVSACLTNHEVMDTLKPGTHGSTYGGNPLACRVAKEALLVLHEEGLVENSLARGDQFRRELMALSSPLIETVRGRGLMNALVVSEEFSAHDLCIEMLKRGLLAKPTHGSTIRLAPPLCITEQEVNEAVEIISESLKGLVK